MTEDSPERQLVKTIRYDLGNAGDAVHTAV